jgi:hypothetical protein
MIKRFIKRCIALWHLSDSVVCEMSTNGKDYHDYRDATLDDPLHFFTYVCKRCGKRFVI